MGYEDVRARFLGLGQRRDPDALDPGPSLRDPADEGLLYGFDPCAALLSRWSCSRWLAEILFARWLGRTSMRGAEDREASFREAASGGAGRDFRAAAACWRRPLFRCCRASPFRRTGATLQTAPAAPRPFSHVFAGPPGFGAVATHDGDIFAFHRNARANSLTPFRIGEGRNAPPGQAIYVVEKRQRRSPCRDAAAPAPRRHAL